ncbi:hypothetical protein JB92DRAFT_47412 [Gautieria morchelliformis]|nr:hypothetical protein JB92DRAFT_47412 [Gautieria morchelliformis]
MVTSYIMVKSNGHQGIILIYFDWAGKFGDVCYPMNVNMVDVSGASLRWRADRTILTTAATVYLIFSSDTLIGSRK